MVSKLILDEIIEEKQKLRKLHDIYNKHCYKNKVCDCGDLEYKSHTFLFFQEIIRRYSKLHPELNFLEIIALIIILTNADVPSELLPKIENLDWDYIKSKNLEAFKSNAISYLYYLAENKKENKFLEFVDKHKEIAFTLLKEYRYFFWGTDKIKDFLVNIGIKYNIEFNIWAISHLPNMDIDIDSIKNKINFKKTKMVEFYLLKSKAEEQLEKIKKIIKKYDLRSIKIK